VPRPLPRAFFARPAHVVARELLGKVLVRRRGRSVTRWPIREVEAYGGSADRASHAFRGRTARNAPMFGPPRVWYVYFVYGVHWMLNVVTGSAGEPSAVLIRAAGDVVGPGALAAALRLDGRWSGRPATRACGAWIEDGPPVASADMKSLPRVGVDYAGPRWAARRLRFLVRARG
jgi:DNA-3-methyladenine glycosylase